MQVFNASAMANVFDHGAPLIQFLLQANIVGVVLSTLLLKMISIVLQIMQTCLITHASCMNYVLII